MTKSTLHLAFRFELPYYKKKKGDLMGIKQRILLISDIGFQIDHFRNLFEQHNCTAFAELTVHCSPGGEAELSAQNPPVTGLNVKESVKVILQSFDLIISYHCRQLFPAEIVTKIRCVNIHPGFNPYNRGWYPGVFSIANGLPAGATIHEIDEKIDNGPIIAQKQINILPEDTSGTVYPKIIQAEYDLLDEWFMPMLTGKYDTFLSTTKGNLNYKKDYYALQELDLDATVKTGDLINRLRALTHTPYQNAYYVNKKTGDRIYISLNISRLTNYSFENNQTVTTSEIPTNDEPQNTK
ncbi:MAG: dTDP-4-amino-4,6-dideoxyglucose formyltransferase [Flavobacteriales bacterium]|nr:dTDP-4-amino-4,6-dideoxyglucose formyltransferase [Flavobacteriales bacterium]